MTGNRQKCALLNVIVTPKSSRREVKTDGERLLVWVTAAASEGKANEMCISLVADWLGVPKSRLRILRGAHHRQKTLAVTGIGQMELNHRLGLTSH
jgi:uncharacterized protein YggU (UPF0235/DUF167 family)